MRETGLICAKVRCVDRATKEFFDRYYWVDLATLSTDQRQLARALSKQTVGPAAFLKLRPLLQMGTKFPQVETRDADFGNHFFVVDYFEDDGGNPLDEIGLMRIVTGLEQPVLAHNVESVLRLGSSGIAQKEEWTVDTANTLAHYFQIVEIIGNGEWLKQRLSIGMPGGPGGGGSARWINSFHCPDLAHIYTMLLPFRQLYAADRVFVNSVDAYLKHTQDERKRWWMEYQKNAFISYLASNPRPHAIENYTVHELLEIVMYGAGLIHYAKTKPAIKKRFHDVITKHHREWVIFTFLMNCRQLYGIANHAYFVMLQDFQHWTTNEGCQPPDLVFQRKLFESHRLRENRDPGEP